MKPFQYKYENRVLSLPMNHSTEHRNHSALKIHCKARQALALVNTKLLEQQGLDYAKLTRVRGPNTCLNTQRENSFELTFKKEINESANDLLEKYLTTKDAFRPSTVKKKIKNSTDEEITLANYESNNKLNTSRRNLMSSKSNSLRQQKENILPSYKKYRNKTDLNLRNKQTTNSETRLPVDLNESFNNNNNKLNINEQTLDIFEPPNSTTTIESPPLPIIQQHDAQTKSASDLFYQILKESSLGGKQQRLHSSPARANSNLNSIQRSNIFSDESSKQLRRISKKSANSSANSLKTVQSNQTEDTNILNNLTDQEFVHLLRQYRQTKNLNALSSSSHVTFLTEIVHRDDNEDKQPEEKEEQNHKVNRTRTAAFVPLPTQTTTLSLRTASNRVSSSISITKKLKSTSRGDLHLTNTNNQNLSTITIADREQLLNRHKLPGYLENYLNKKMTEKNLKQNNTKDKTKSDQQNVHTISSTSLTPTSLSKKKTNENKANTKNVALSAKNLHRIKSSSVKLFNFPTLAN